MAVDCGEGVGVMARFVNHSTRKGLLNLVKDR